VPAGLTSIHVLRWRTGEPWIHGASSVNNPLGRLLFAARDVPPVRALLGPCAACQRLSPSSENRSAFRDTRRENGSRGAWRTATAA